jgi:hypothetical protein
MVRNLRSGFRLRRREGPAMRDFDRLPAALRHWLHQAALPWSPASARRAWARALSDCGGSEVAALARLTQIEQARLRSERRQEPGVTAASQSRTMPPSHSALSATSCAPEYRTDAR